MRDGCRVLLGILALSGCTAQEGMVHRYLREAHGLRDPYE